MVKHYHEIRDPVHTFIRIDSDERTVLDSRPFQRLRYVHQLALTYLVYPGATHRRFEHSLGVMEIASRIYDTITAETNRYDALRDVFPRADQLVYWRKALRMAALCHDLGHLPFSHASEDLLPPNRSHENITAALIESQEMRDLWEAMIPPLTASHVTKLAVGPKVLRDQQFSEWETLLSDIISGSAFGADRIDYLLRDSLHTGVAYGRFDYHRLIDTIRILPTPDGASAPALGIESGGLQSAEALLLARYFMFSQLYFHHVRRAYDIHLRDYLKDTLPSGVYSVDPEQHLRTTDNEVLVSLRESAQTSGAPGHEHARRILKREHFRRLYEKNPLDTRTNLRAAEAIYEAAKLEFGEPNIRYDDNPQRSVPIDFPVLTSDARVTSSLSLSKTLGDIPVGEATYVFVAPEMRAKAAAWLAENRDRIVAADAQVEEDQ